MTYIEWLEDKCLHIFDESWVCDLMSEHADEWEYCSKHCENGKGECLRRLYKADRKTEPTISKMKWILCDERLPDDNREVLISLEWGIDIGTYERGEWRSEWINHYDDDNVLAWMPLPKPWKGADDE